MSIHWTKASREQARKEAATKFQAELDAKVKARSDRIREGVDQLKSLTRLDAENLIEKIEKDNPGTPYRSAHLEAAEIVATYYFEIGEKDKARVALGDIAGYDRSDVARWMEKKGDMQYALKLYAEVVELDETLNGITSYTRVAKALGVEPDKRVIAAARLHEILREGRWNT